MSSFEPAPRKPVQVCICGGGNGVHVMAALTPSLLPDTKVHILSTFSDEAEKINKGLEEVGKIKLKKAEHDKTVSIIEGAPALVTKDPAQAAPGSDLIVIPLPAFAHAGYIEAIAPHIQDGATLVGMPMYPGFAWVVRKILGEDKFGKIKIIGSDSLPWAARLTEYGKSAEVIGTKSVLLGACTDPSTLAPLQACLGRCPVLYHGSGITADLMTTNPYIHLAIMYSKWSFWDGKPLKEKPLFYQGADTMAALVMSKLSVELVVDTKDAIKRLKPELNLDRVVHIHQWYLNCYSEQTEDKSTLLSCLQTNGGYRGLTHPMKEVEDGMFMPDFKYRYMTEDLPMGLVPLRAISNMAGVSTPMTDKVILWCQKAAGKEYLIEKDGLLVLEGKDIGETRAPVNFGVTSIDQMLW